LISERENLIGGACGKCLRTVVDGLFGDGRDDEQADDSWVADVVVLVAALVVAGRIAQHAGARQLRRLPVGVEVSVELERHVVTSAGAPRHQSVRLVPRDHRRVVADTHERHVIAGLQRQRRLGWLDELQSCQQPHTSSVTPALMIIFRSSSRLPTFAQHQETETVGTQFKGI